MATIVIAFESTYGQTHKIAEHVADRARRQGHSTRLVRASIATHAILDDADAFVVVAPVYFGKHPRAIRRLLRNYAGTLAARPMAFISVSNSAARTGTEAYTQAERLANSAMAMQGLKPAAVACAAGALAYPRYGFFLRQMMRMIAKSTGGPVDTTQIHELTSWERLDSDLTPFFSKVDEREEQRHAA